MAGDTIILTPAMRSRRRMAQRLGFESVRALEAWEEEIVIDRTSNPSYLSPPRPPLQAVAGL
jgi:hypothetical protein